MGDVGEFWNDIKALRAERKERLGIKCPACIQREPKRNPTVLLPGQKCYCGYRDKRKRRGE